MFESREVRNLKIQLADQRRINERLRRDVGETSAMRRILDRALQDAHKLIDLHNAGEPTTRDAVHGLISHRHFYYTMAFLKAGNVVRGGGRGEPYRWRRMTQRQMIDIANATHERLCNSPALILEHLPVSVRERVAALPPTGYH